MVSAAAGDGVALASAVGLLVLAWLLGEGLLGRTPLQSAERVERIVLATGLGLGLLAYLPFLLVRLTPGTIRAAWTLCALIGIGLQIWNRRATPPIENPIPKIESRPSKVANPIPLWCAVIVGVGGLFLLAVFLKAFTPLNDYDGLTYHVAAPKRWLELGSLRYLPTQLQTQWPMGSEMLYLLLLPVGGPGACKPLVTLLALLTCGALYALSVRLDCRRAALIAPTLFLLARRLGNLDTTSVETALTCAVTLAALALAAWRQSDAARERRAWLLLAACFAGFACCIKLSGLLPCAVLTLVTLAMPRPAGVKPEARLREGATFVLVALVCASPWYARTWLNTGNPIYPFAYGLFGGRDWNAHAEAVLSDYLRYFDLPGATLAIKRAHVLTQLFKLGALTLLAAALPVSRPLRGLILATGGFALAQVATSDQIRFLLPAAPFLALLLGFWVVRAAARWPVVGWVFALALAARYLPETRDLALATWPAARGLVPRARYIRNRVKVMEASLWANKNLPPDARVLFGPDTRVYFLQRDAYVTQQITQQQINMDTPQTCADSLRRAGIGYFLFNPALRSNPTLVFETGMGWRANELRRLAELAARSTLLKEIDGVAVYRLPPDITGAQK